MNKAALILTVMILLISCSKTEDVSPLTVHRGDNNYVNEYFGLSVQKPEGWYAQSAEETIILQQKGMEVIAGDDENMKAMIKASMDSNIPLFGFFEFPPGTPGKLNPNVLSAAENTKGFPGIQSGCDYLYLMIETLNRGQYSYQFSDGCSSRMIGGKEFGYVSSSMTMSTMSINQKYFASVEKDHAITIVQTYADERGHEATNNIVSSIKFSTR